LISGPGFRRDEVEPGDHIEGVDERFRDAADFGAQSSEDAFDLAVLFPLQRHALGAEVRDRCRFDEDGLARAADAVDDSRHFVPVVHRHGENVVVAVDGRVRVAEDLPQFGVAQQPFDLPLHALVEFEEFLPYGREFTAGDVEDMGAAVDASADGPGDGAEIFDAAEEVDEAVQSLVESHPVAVDGPGAGERLGDFEELLRAEHRADARPADEQADIVQTAERRRLFEFEREYHLGDEADFLAQRAEVLQRFHRAGEFAAEGRCGEAGDDLAHFAELEEVGRVGIHGVGRRR
jgi:hypothetical protein